MPSLQGQTQQNGGFGAAWGDFDNDGYLDLFVANSGGKNVLFRNRGDGTFAKVTTAPSTDGADSCGAAWGDYDRDGYLDLFVVNGNVGQNADANFLYHNQGDGTFVKMTAGQVGPIVGDLRKWVLGSWVDYDGDGWLDMCVPNGNNLCLYQNNGNSNNWLCVTCVGTSSPRDGTGAKVRALATIRGKPMWQLRLLNCGGTCWGGQSFVAHFGLGDATNVDVLRIEWTSGLVQELYNVPAKQYLTVTEPARLSMPSLGELHIQCWNGMAYRIEGSPDLSAWAPLATLTNLTGKLQWTDTNAPGQSARSYRAVKQ